MPFAFRSLATLLALTLILYVPVVKAQESPSQGVTAPSPAAPTTQMTLSQLEQTALQTNPTLAEAQAVIRAAQAKRLQAGLLPNPVVGGQVDNFAFRAPGKKTDYQGFVVQTIPLGGKLKKMRQVFQAEVTQAEVEALSQRQRVLNTIRSLFYEVLGAQLTIDLQLELASIARTATQTTSEMFNVGQADKPDFLESQIEQEQVAHNLQVARNLYARSWRALAAVIGRLDMAPVRLQGSLEDQSIAVDEEAIYRKLIDQSPQIKAAQAQIQRARAVLVRAKAEPAPDLYVRGSLGYSTEFLDTGNDSPPPRTGLIGSGQVGVTLPIFNRNPGGIASARAEVAFAEHELERLKLTLRVALAGRIAEYNNALDAVTRYRTTIVPRAQEAYQLYLTKFQSMAAAYPQVLIAQRTLFQMRQKYITALVGLQQDRTQLEGFLLSGGLDIPRAQFELTAERGSMTGLFGQYASEEGDISSLDEAHNVDHY